MSSDKGVLFVRYTVDARNKDVIVVMDNLRGEEFCTVNVFFPLTHEEAKQRAYTIAYNMNTFNNLKDKNSVDPDGIYIPTDSIKELAIWSGFGDKIFTYQELESIKDFFGGRTVAAIDIHWFTSNMGREATEEEMEQLNTKDFIVDNWPEKE